MGRGRLPHVAIGSVLRRLWSYDKVGQAGDAGDAVRSLGGEDPLEEGVATHSSILAWSIPRTEEPGGLQSTGSHRVGHD